MKKQLIKIFFLAVCFLSFYNNSQAQVDSAKAVKLKKELIDTICTCVSQIDTSALKTADDVQGVFMKCFMSNGMSIFMDYAAASGIDFTNMDQMQDIGKRLGIELTGSCPAFLKMAMKIASNSDELKKLMDQNKSGTSSGTSGDTQKN